MKRPAWQPTPLAQLNNLVYKRKEQIAQQKNANTNKHSNKSSSSTTQPHTISHNPTSAKASRRGPCHFGHVATSARTSSKDVWLANPNPSFWRGVAVGVTLCQRCYGIGHRARAKGKKPVMPCHVLTIPTEEEPTTTTTIQPADATTAPTAADTGQKTQQTKRRRIHFHADQLPEPIAGPPLQLLCGVSKPELHSLKQPQLGTSLTATATQSQPEQSADGQREFTRQLSVQTRPGFDAPEHPQPSKHRRTKEDDESAERRRLEKSLSLYHLPCAPSQDGRRAHQSPSMRLSTIPMPKGPDTVHNDLPFAFNKLSVCASLLNSFFNFETKRNLSLCSKRHPASHPSVSQGLALDTRKYNFVTFAHDERSLEPFDLLSNALPKAPAGGNSPAGRVVVEHAHNLNDEEKNPATLRHRPPEKELHGSSPLDST